MMDMGTWAVLISACALLLNFTDKIFGGGTRLSGRLTKIEAGMLAMQDEVKRLVETMAKVADMRGDIRVLDTRLLMVEQDIKELRHGDGYIKARSAPASD
ncbi:hypothetical protein ACVSQ4_27825 [Klebsiella pneumoniae]